LRINQFTKRAGVDCERLYGLGDVLQLQRAQFAKDERELASTWS
jgi:hypothetical protein